MLSSILYVNYFIKTEKFNDLSYFVDPVHNLEISKMIQFLHSSVLEGQVSV